MRKLSSSIVGRGKVILKEAGPVTLLRRSLSFLRWRFSFLEINIRHTANKWKYGEAAAPPFKIIELPPQNVIWWTDRYRKYSDVGKIEDGNWDLDLERVENHLKYVAIENHFKHGVPWDETQLFSKFEKILSEGGHVDGYHTMDQIYERYKKIDRIYENINTEGFKDPVDTTESQLPKREALDYPAVHIGRDGDFILACGWHRFAISRLLNIDKIPFRVIVRHLDWQMVRDQYLRSKPEDVPDDHPDLHDL